MNSLQGPAAAAPGTTHGTAAAVPATSVVEEPPPLDVKHMDETHMQLVQSAAATSKSEKAKQAAAKRVAKTASDTRRINKAAETLVSKRLAAERALAMTDGTAGVVKPEPLSTPASSSKSKTKAGGPIGSDRRNVAAMVARGYQGRC